MADLIAALPGQVGYLIGSGVWLFLLSRVLFAAAPKLRRSGKRLLLGHALVVGVVIIIISQGFSASGFGEDAFLNAIAATLLWIWDGSRLGRGAPEDGHQARIEPAGAPSASSLTDPARMVWTAWNNGAFHQTGAGYGFKVLAEDRDRLFERQWQTVIIELPGHQSPVLAVANVDKASFWSSECRELISQAIGQWLLDNGHAPWPSGSPPKFSVEGTGGGRFVVNNRTA